MSQKSKQGEHNKKVKEEKTEEKPKTLKEPKCK